MKFISKAMLLMVLFLLSSSLLAQRTVSLRAYGDFSGKFKFEFEGFSDEQDVNMGYSAALDLLFINIGNLTLGAGGAYELPRDFKSEEDGAEESGKFNFIPVYGVVKFNLANGSFRPQLVGQIGYNFFQGDDQFTSDGYGGSFTLDGGLYWGAGVDIEMGSFIIGAIYRNHKAQATAGDFTFDVYYNTISAGIGFNF